LACWAGLHARVSFPSFTPCLSFSPLSDSAPFSLGGPVFPFCNRSLARRRGKSKWLRKEDFRSAGPSGHWRRATFQMAGCWPSDRRRLFRVPVVFFFPGETGQERRRSFLFSVAGPPKPPKGCFPHPTSPVENPPPPPPPPSPPQPPPPPPHPPQNPPPPPLPLQMRWKSFYFMPGKHISLFLSLLLRLTSPPPSPLRGSAPHYWG